MDLSLFNAIFLVLQFIFCLLVYVIISRLFFHPLASIPGPCLAAITSLYRFYYCVVRGGEMIDHLKYLHKVYGQWLNGNYMALWGIGTHWLSRPQSPNRPKWGRLKTEWMFKFSEFDIYRFILPIRTRISTYIILEALPKIQISTALFLFHMGHLQRQIIRRQKNIENHSCDCSPASKPFSRRWKLCLRWANDWFAWLCLIDITF